MNTQAILEALYQRFEAWARSAVGFLPELFVAILVIIVFRYLSRLICSGVGRVLTRVSGDSSLVSLTTTVVRIIVMMIGLFIALSILGLDKAVTSLLAGAGVIALAVGFAFQDLTANFISGTIIAIQRPIEVGDLVETNGFQGRVISVKLRSVVLDNFGGQTIEIPSKDVFQKPIINYSRLGARRVELLCGVSYLDDLNKAERVAADTIRALPFVLDTRPVQVFFRAFGGDMVQFSAFFWVDPVATNASAALSDAIKAIKQAFDRNDLLIMFPADTFDRKKRVREAREQAETGTAL